MKFRLFVLLLLVSKLSYAQSDKLDDQEVANINNIIALFKQENIDGISDIIAFPLRREYPIPNIKNKKEFKQRFGEVFDKTLLARIADSKTDQWSEVGWRGIMLDRGVVWIDSYTGKIKAVNYESDFEKKLRKKLIAKDKENLHISLKTFESPVYKIKTKNYLIRIDNLSDTGYRYASWKKESKESSKPDIILNNGALEFQGSGGNHVVTFINKNYTYKVYRNIMGEENMPDITLEIEKDGQVILKENGKLILE